jgi:membrane-associated protease RseP (regulator of RpoE activity)
MNVWKTAAVAKAMAPRATIAAVLVVAAGIGAALTPRTQAQEAVVAVMPPEPPHIDVDAVVQGALAFGRGRLGVTVRDVSDDDVKKGGLGGSRGVVIEQVTEESAAHQAGLKAGDIVVEFDGERVRSVQQFTRLVQETPTGRSVPAVVVRDGQKTTLTVQPRDSWAGFREDFGNMLRYEIPSRIVTPRPPAAPRTPSAPVPAPAPFTFSMRGGTVIGVTVSDMSDQLGEYFGAKGGALVTSVTDNSPAARAGVKAGDVITAINGQEIKVPSDVRRATQRLASGAEFTIDVLRDKKKLTLKGKAENRQTGRRIVI